MAVQFQQLGLFKTVPKTVTLEVEKDITVGELYTMLAQRYPEIAQKDLTDWGKWKETYYLIVNGVNVTTLGRSDAESLAYPVPNGTRAMLTVAMFGG